MKKMKYETIQRISEIVELRNSNFTLQEIGDHFGLSRERIRQLLEEDKKNNIYNSEYVSDDIKKTIKSKKVGNYYLEDRKYLSLADIIREKFPKYNQEEMKSVYVRVLNYVKENNVSFEDACQKIIENNKKKECIYNRKVYKNKMEMIKDLFPNKDYRNVYYSIMQRKRIHKTSFEEALKMTLNAANKN